MRTEAKLVMLLLTTMIVLAQTRSAKAADTPNEGAPHWYGWEYGAADVAGLTMLLDARLESKTPLVNAPFLERGNRHLPFVAEPSTAEAVGGGLYLGGAPLVHLANGHPLNALASLSLRALPLLYVQMTAPMGGFVGFFVRDSHGQPSSCNRDPGQWLDFCMDLAAGSHVNDGVTTGADIGLFGGAAAAVLVDQVLFSRESLGAKPKRGSFADGLTPDVRVGNGSAYAGVGGRF